MDLFLHETATFRSPDVPDRAAIEEYLESPVVNADDQPAFEAAFRAVHFHAPHAIGRLLVRRYHGAVYGDAGCLAWLLTVTGTKLLAIVAIYALVNSSGPRELMLALAALGVGMLAVGMLLVLHCRRRNFADCVSFVETLEPLSERDPGAIVETLPLLERVAADTGVAETTRSSAGVVAARLRASLRSELPVVASEPAADASTLPLCSVNCRDGSVGGIDEYRGDHRAGSIDPCSSVAIR